MDKKKRRKLLIPALVVLIALSAVLISPDSSQRADLLIGTDNGEVLAYSNDEITQIAKVEGVIHHITRYNGEIFASAKIGNRSFLYDITDNKTVYSSKRSFHGFDISGESIYLGFQDSEEILKISMEGQTISNASTDGKPHYVKAGDGKVFVGNTNGLIEVFNTELEKRSEIETGNWLGSFRQRGDKTIVAGRKILKVNTSGHIHEVTEGHVTVKDSNQSLSINLSPTVVPHGISELENGKIAVTNMVNGTVLIVDENLSKVTNRIALGPRSEPYFTSLLETQNGKIFAGDIEKNRLYIIDMHEEELIDVRIIEGIHSIQTP